MYQHGTIDGITLWTKFEWILSNTERTSATGYGLAKWPTNGTAQGHRSSASVSNLPSARFSVSFAQNELFDRIKCIRFENDTLNLFIFSYNSMEKQSKFCLFLFNFSNSKINTYLNNNENK